MLRRALDSERACAQLQTGQAARFVALQLLPLLAGLVVVSEGKGT
jgi:hypothetical protein